MADETNEPSAVIGLLLIGSLLAAGYFGYTKLFPSDRAQVRSCISTIMDASRGDVGYGEYRQKLADLDQADEVVIADVIRRPWGGETIVTIDYLVDGRRSGIMCAQ